MSSQTHRTVVSAVRRTILLCVALLFCSSVTFGVNEQPNRVFCREDLSPRRRQELENKLRAITGWINLGFDRYGALQVGNELRQGSSTARDLLKQTVAGDNVLVIEDASNRQDVVFSRVVPARWNNTSPDNPPAYVVLIDFADFDHLIGDKAALKAFDVGWALLHEFDHVVNNSHDAEDLNDAGECEGHINQMRQECDLPLRAEYFYTYFPHSEESEFKTRFVRLAFDRRDSSVKRRRYWVMWDASLVGAIPPSSLVASLNR